MLSRSLSIIAAFLILGRLSAQGSGCPTCIQQDRPGTFHPPVLQVGLGDDVEAEVQFALPDSLLIGGAWLYANYAFFVDSLRMEGGTDYVTLRAMPNTPVSYNISDPAMGAIRFDALHRYKQISRSPVRYAHVVVYQNPGGTPGQTPPRGCFRLCIRGKAITPTADSLRLFVRAFGQENTVRNDRPNKDTSDLMPFVNYGTGSANLWLDTLLKYPIQVRMATSSIQWQSLSKIEIHPNPAWGRVSLRYNLDMPASVGVRVYSMTGSLIAEEALGMRPIGSHEYFLALPSGAYIVEVHTDNGSLREKVIVVE